MRPLGKDLGTIFLSGRLHSRRELRSLSLVPFASKKMRDWMRETKGLIIYVLHEFSTCDSFLNNFRSIYPARPSSSSSCSSSEEEEERCMPYNPRVSSRLYTREPSYVCTPLRVFEIFNRRLDWPHANHLARTRAPARFQPAIRLAS